MGNRDPYSDTLCRDNFRKNCPSEDAARDQSSSPEKLSSALLFVRHVSVPLAVRLLKKRSLNEKRETQNVKCGLISAFDV